MKYYDYDDSHYIFGYTRPLAPENIRRHFNNYIDKANNSTDSNLRDNDCIPKIRVHDLRHSHASYLINNKSDKFTDFDIVKRLGDTVQTLHDTYAHWFKAADKGIVNFMDENMS